MEYILTIDIGTTSVKCGVFERSLRPLRFFSAEYDLITPDASIVEVKPEIYLEKIRECVDAMRNTGIETGKVRSIIVTTQGETFIPIDASNRVLSNAIVWLDNRATKEAATLSGLFSDDTIYRKTGLPGFDGYTPIAKMMQIQKRVAQNGSRVAKYLLLEDFITWKLTGCITTEKTLLSSTGFFDLKKDRLWSDVLSAANIPAETIPEALESGEVIGGILPEMADFLMVSRDAVVVSGAMDQLCGAIGCGNICEGRMHETTGTALVIGASTSEPNFDNPYRITVYRHAVAGLYMMLTICRTAAIIQKWFCEQCCAEEVREARRRGISVYDYLTELTQDDAPNEHGPILFPYFNGCLAPVPMENARGAFWGIGLNTTKKDLIRAIPEGIAFMLRENLEMLDSIGMTGHSLYSLGGPSQNAYWCQMKADITGREIIAAPGLESTSFGAACLAAVSAGFFANISDAVSAYREYKCFMPRGDAQETYHKKYLAYRRLAECAAVFYKQ